MVNEPTGETHAVGIVGTPIGCEAVFGVRPSTIRGQAVDLATAWPAAANLRDRLLELAQPAAKLDLIEQHLVAHLNPAVPGLDRCEQAIAILEANPTRPIADVAASLGVSHEHLDREFTRVVGLSPRALARLLRVRRLLERIDVRGDVDWAAIAADLGWFDQAHLIRDFKRHTGVTPRAYIAAQRAYQPTDVGDAAGFVPEV